MNRARASRDTEHVRDSGASLILAIAFVLLVGAIASGLIGLATSSLNNRASLEGVRNRQYAADGAIEQALTVVRAQVGTPLVTCALASNFVLDSTLGTPIRVDWQNACGVVQSVEGNVVAQRNVIFAACVDTGAACLDADVIIRAQVNLQQAASGAVTKTYVQSWSVHR
jgi:type II secretory pathway component PulK